MLKRITIYCIGLFIIAMGISLSVKSNLGVSPVNSLPYIMSLIFKVELGLCVTLVFISMIVLQLLILRKEFRIYDILQVFCASLFGYFVTLSNIMLSFLVPEHYLARIICLAISIIMIGIGIYIYLQANFIPLPAEGVVIALKKKTVFQFHNIKVGFDLTMVVSSLIISFLFFQKIHGIGIGTILASILIGKVVGFVPKILQKFNLKIAK